MQKVKPAPQPHTVPYEYRLAIVKVPRGPETQSIPAGQIEFIQPVQEKVRVPVLLHSLPLSGTELKFSTPLKLSLQRKGGFWFCSCTEFALETWGEQFDESLEAMREMLVAFYETIVLAPEHGLTEQAKKLKAKLNSLDRVS